MNIFDFADFAVNALFSSLLNLKKLLTASQFLMSSQIKVGPSPSKKIFSLLQWKPFKDDEKYFLFHLKSSFRFQGI